MNSVNRIYTKILVFPVLFVCLFINGLSAETVYIRMTQENYRQASLQLQNDLRLIASEKGVSLYACESSILPQIASAGLAYEKIESYDHLIREDLPPMPNGGIPLSVVVKRGNQGMAGWHEGAAMAGHVLAYMETNIDGQLPGFTFWDMEKDSVWHHYIDTALDGDEPLFMAASKNRIYYTFHYMNPAISNSDMRYYWYDVRTDEHGEVENFGYGYEGFGVSDTWMMRVGNKGMGWNNQIFAHNIETGERFELIADSTLGSWGYNYDNFGGPKTNGNTVIYTYIDYDTYTPDLVVRSLGEDGEFGTADDIGGTICSTATSYDSYRVDGRYIVWVERIPGDEGNVRAYDMGEDELYGTADDEGFLEICTNTYKQATVRIDDNIIVWEDWRNVTGTAGNGEHDIYGYDLATDTEFRSTARSDSLMMTDINGDEVLLIKSDWGDANSYNDIYLMNITGRIQSDYYRIDVLNLGEPVAQSLLTGTTEISPYYFNNVSSAAKGPLCAVFTMSVAGVDRVLAYSAVTGNWSTEELYYSDDFVSYINKENALILGYGEENNDGGSHYSAWIFNGQTGDFAPRETITRPDGFSVGKNLSFIWGTISTQHWIRTYDAGRNDWYYRSAYTNDPWHMITTNISDSLGMILYGQGDTLCDNIGLEVYDLELHDWVGFGTMTNYIHQLNRHSWENVLKLNINTRFAVAALESEPYNDYIYTYGMGDGDWKLYRTPSGDDLERPILGENFIVQSGRSGDEWRCHIFNGCSGEWLPEPIESVRGLNGLYLYKDMMVAWEYKEPPYAYAKVWAYSSNADGIQSLNISNPGELLTVKAASEAAYVADIKTSTWYGDSYVHVFNALIGKWCDPMEVDYSNQILLEASGNTALFVEKTGSFNGTNIWKAYGYSALVDMWDNFEFKSNAFNGIHTSDFCGLLDYDDTIYGRKYLHAYNGVDGEWSEDIINMYPTRLNGLSMNDRIMMVVEDDPADYTYAKVHVFSPILNLWNSMTFDTQYYYSLEGYYTTPTSAFAWNNEQFRIIFSTQTDWDKKYGRLDELYVTDYAIEATLYNAGVMTTYYFYPPVTEVIEVFKFSEEPTINVKSSWAAEIKWKTNKNSDTRLVWGVDGYYEIIEKDTLEPTKDHRVLIEGLEAQKTYYYAAISMIPGLDTLYSDTLTFNTGVDTEAPQLVDAPHPYRIHDHEASVWWKTNEPSTPIIQWGLTTDYTDTLEYNGAEPYLTNAVRLYGLAKDTTYHYRVGGYDRYGNGPFFSGDHTFRTHNKLPVVTDLAQADSLLWGAAYMTWEPPRIDSSFSEEKFTHGIPVDWKVYNRGDSQKGSTWTGGYLGNNPVAYCPYGSQGERQEEWLISNPITIDGTTGGVLNFWHMGFYNDYDNAPNRVMVSWTGTEPSDFSTVWSSQDLPDNWTLVQINLNYNANFGKTMYIAFVYESTYGESWVIDNVYMDFTIDGYYENFNDLTGWTNAGGRWGLKGEYNNYSLGVDGIKESSYLPDPIETWDAWEISPFIQITESHHILGFWQMGWAGEYDTKPNEIRVVHSTYSIEASSEVVKTVYPVPNGWQWTTVDLSAYIGQTVMIGFRYNSNVGWWWNGTEWLAFWGEDWYIDDMYLFENAPAMVADPNAKPNEKPLKFASSPNGKPIDLGQFKTIRPVQAASDKLTAEAPEGSIDLPKEKPSVAVKLPEIKSDPVPSVLAEPKPELYGYEVYGRYPGEAYFSYLGYVTSPSFVDWSTYLGYECEYYVEAVYDQGNSQPSNKAMIKGGRKYAANEYGYDTGILYYSYWWYPGTGFINKFSFEDSILTLEKIKVHIAKPGSFKLNINYTTDDIAINQTTSTINAPEEGWYLIDPPVYPGYYDVSSRYFIVEFLPQDTLVQLSYDDFDCGYSWFDNGSQITPADVTFYIRLIGEKSPYVGVADIPDEFSLAQNYPNPFNPTTTIHFEIPEASEVDIRIYDIRGTLVKTLASDHREAGRYQIVWDATNMSGTDVASGVYLIRMTAGDFTETRKMVLVR